MVYIYLQYKYIILSYSIYILCCIYNLYSHTIRFYNLFILNIYYITYTLYMQKE